MPIKKKYSNLAAAILAGGKNSRMAGENKALLKFKGEPLIKRTLRVLRGIFDEIILVTNSAKDFAPLEKEALIVSDILKDAGPLGGIHAGLTATGKDAVFFVACDMPFLHNDIILRELKYFHETPCDCLVPRIGSFLEPLCAIYKKDIKDRIALFLKKSSDRSVKSFLQTINTYYLDLSEDAIHYRNMFINVNTPKELEKIIRSCE